MFMFYMYVSCLFLEINIFMVNEIIKSMQQGAPTRRSCWVIYRNNGTTKPSHFVWNWNHSSFKWQLLTTSFIVKCVKFWRKRRKFICFPRKIYHRKDERSFFERLHTMTSQRPNSCASLLSCILIKTDILRTFIGQRHNFLFRIYVRDIQSSIFVHIIDDRYQQIPGHKLTRVCQLPAQTFRQGWWPITRVTNTDDYSINSFDWISTINTVIIVTPTMRSAKALFTRRKKKKHSLQNFLNVCEILQNELRVKRTVMFYMSYIPCEIFANIEKICHWSGPTCTKDRSRMVTHARRAPHASET